MKVDALTAKLTNGLHNVTKTVEQLLSQPQQRANSSVKDFAFSSKKVSVKLRQLAHDFPVKNFVCTDWVVHSCGVGGKLPYLDGMNGADGISGRVYRDAQAGRGHDGTDGNDWMVGELRSPGLDCADFKIGILVQTIEDRKFAYISHSGQKGGDGESVTFHGGKGGKGAKGGRGGPGGNGSRVLISTDDPLLLMSLVVDCTGGKGGVSGFRGERGLRGFSGKHVTTWQAHALNGDPGQSGAVAFQILQKAELQVATVTNEVTAATTLPFER
eukprot:3449594-Rhodomonas_salina.1